MQSSTIQVVFFDIDGTLVDHAAAARAGALGMFGRYRDRLTDCDERLLQRWRTLEDDQFDRYLRGETSYAGQRIARIRGLFGLTRSEMPDSQADEIFSVYRELYESAWSLFPDVVDTLDALGRCRLGVISNGASLEQREKLAGVGILDRFEVVVVSEDVGAAKPDPKIFKAACKAAGAPPSACLHVGDRLDLDAIGACDAGLRGVWIDRDGEGQGPPNVTAITRLTQLPALVLEP